MDILYVEPNYNLSAYMFSYLLYRILMSKF